MSELSWLDRLLIKIALAKRLARGFSAMQDDGEELAAAYSKINLCETQNARPASRAEQ